MLNRHWLEHDGGQAIAPLVRDAVAGALPLLHTPPSAVFARAPFTDPLCPIASDLDLLVFADVAGVLPERVAVEIGGEQRLLDLLWLPRSLLEETERISVYGLIPHRLITSVLVVEEAGSGAAARRDAAHAAMYQPAAQRRRIAGLLEMAQATVREVGVTWDFPALALFWLHMAFAACLSAMLDARRIACPNVYTRPFDYLPLLAGVVPDLEHRVVRALRLAADTRADVAPDVESMIPALTRLSGSVIACTAPFAWPEGIRADMRFEYDYFRAPSELAWRIRIAQELEAGGHRHAAVFYLRFMAYALARVPMVYQRAREGIECSFLRPERSVRRDLERHCPRSLEGLPFLLAGGLGTGIAEVENSLEQLLAFRDTALAVIRDAGVALPEPPMWKPHRTSSGF